MDSLSAFLFENKAKRDNIFVELSPDFKDDKGNVIKWELRAVSTEEEQEIRASSMDYIEGSYRLDTIKYLERLSARAVVYPNLYDAKLQDSYGVKTPERLLKALLDKPAYYNRLTAKVQRLNGYSNINEDTLKAKN